MVVVHVQLALYCYWYVIRERGLSHGPILSLRGSLGAFGTSPAQSLCVETNESPLHLRREKLALQFATKIAANPNNPLYDTMFNPRYVDIFRRKPRVNPTFGIRIKE